MRTRFLYMLLALAALAAPLAATAKVVRVEIISRENIVDGRSFGAVGPYEKIVGIVYFAFDPANPMNARSSCDRNARCPAAAWLCSRSATAGEKRRCPTSTAPPAASTPSTQSTSETGS